MRFRIRLARFLIKLGAFIQSLPIVVMRPDDLVEFSHHTYAKQDDIESWAEDSHVDSGLSSDELDLLTKLPTTGGNLLLLGVGGGREAIPFAKMGFNVTGVDYVDAMVERAKENTARRGVHIEGLVQEISKLNVPAKSFDVVWLSRAMYSCVPTRARRVKMVRLINNSLKPGGYFLFQFLWISRLPLTKKERFFRRIISVLTFGNRAYEEGDTLWHNKEFLHSFSSEEEVRSEIDEGGLSVLFFKTNFPLGRGWAVCQKKLKPN